MQLKAQIALEKDNKSILDNHTTLIQQNADAIVLKASSQSLTDLAGRVTTAEGTIVVQAGQIASKVASTDYNGVTIASLINQTAETIKIQAGHIALEGIITANGNVVIETDGSITVNNGTFKGSVNTALDSTIGQSLNMPVYTPTGTTDRLNILNNGSKGLRYGLATNKNAFITVIDNQRIISGTTGVAANESLHMKLFTNETLTLKSTYLSIIANTMQMSFDGGTTSYAIYRDANGFLKAG